MVIFILFKSFLIFQRYFADNRQPLAVQQLNDISINFILLIYRTNKKKTRNNKNNGINPSTIHNMWNHIQFNIIGLA